jgi:hypothetical protein
MRIRTLEYPRYALQVLHSNFRIQSGLLVYHTVREQHLISQN